MHRSEYIPAREMLQSPSFLDFLRAARDWCSLIESENGFSEVEFLYKAQELLALLYSLGIQLQWVELKDDEDIEVLIDEPTMNAVLQSISRRLPLSYYWTTLNPIEMEQEAEIGAGDLVDDLGDIYHDLKAGIQFFDRADLRSKENALWQFKTDFVQHWGRHCISALLVIHHYLARREF